MSDYLLILALVLGVIGLLLFLFAWISSEARNEDKRAEKLKEERAIRDKEEQALKVQLENHKADLTNQYGKITKEFFCQVTTMFILYQQKKIVFFCLVKLERYGFVVPFMILKTFLVVAFPITFIWKKEKWNIKQKHLQVVWLDEQ